MASTLLLYTKLTWLFALLTTVIVFNFAVWGLHRHPTSPVWYIPGANAEHGRELIRSYGCGACHVIPGVRGTVGEVGPRLDRVKDQIYIAGSLPNLPSNLTTWITKPRDLEPQTLMPNLGMSDQDARDIAEYLLSRSR